MKLEDVRSLHPFNYFCSHAGVHLNRCNVLRLFKNFYSQVSGTGPDFHDLVCRLEVRLNVKGRRVNEFYGFAMVGEQVRNQGGRSRRTASTILDRIFVSELHRY